MATSVVWQSLDSRLKQFVSFTIEKYAIKELSGDILKETLGIKIGDNIFNET